jgi:cold shock CspA family protein
MTKSKETQNKKEKEKKKLKKRQDKQQKKEDRKTNSDKGKSFDDMIAYVDEYGNITSTPPDPMKKKIAVKAEDIQIGVSRREDIEDSDEPRSGSITFFNESKGYGFIKDSITQESIFVHINNLSEPVKENDKVTFDTERGPKGLSAINVKIKK